MREAANRALKLKLYKKLCEEGIGVSSEEIIGRFKEIVRKASTMSGQPEGEVNAKALEMIMSEEAFAGIRDVVRSLFPGAVERPTGAGIASRSGLFGIGVSSRPETGDGYSADYEYK